VRVSWKFGRTLTRGENSLRDHLAPDDVAGALKEGRGIMIPDPRGGVFDHVREVTNARDGIVNAIDGLKETLITMERTGAAEAQQEQVRGILSLLSQTIDDLEKRM
jgi:hypothetical protein